MSNVGLAKSRCVLVLGNTVLTEYEEILKREATTLGLTFERIHKTLDALCTLAERRYPSDAWLPVLSDPDDEPLVHLAVESKADHLISHNIRHLDPARKLGVNLLEPRDFLAIIQP